MRIQQRPLQVEQQQRKRKKGRDSEQQSGLLNITEQLKEQMNEDQSCVEKIKSSVFPLCLTFVLFIIVCVVFYRYFQMLNRPKVKFRQDFTQNDFISHKKNSNEGKQSPIEKKQSHKQEQKQSFENTQIKVQETEEKSSQINEFLMKLWVFDQNQGTKEIEQQQYFDGYYKNWQHFSNLSNISIENVSYKNYKQFISNQNVIDMIGTVQSFFQSSQRKHKLLEIILMVSILQNKGGLSISGDMIFTKAINEYIKKVQQNQKHSLFAFESEEISVKKRFVNIQNHFIMARKSCPILKQFLSKIIQIIDSSIKPLQKKKPQAIIRDLQEAFSQITYQNSFFKNSFYSLGKQQQINIKNNPFINLQLQYHFKYLYSLQQQALQDMIGPLNTITQFPLNLYQKFILKFNDHQKSQILSNSFLYQNLLTFDKKDTNLQPITIINPKTQYNKIWQLPKILWTIFTKNHISDPLHDYFLTNLYEKAQLSGFQLIILTQSNLKTIFNENELRQIRSIIEKMNFNQNQNAMSPIKEDDILTEIIKLKVLSKYGGVFVNHGYFLLDNFEWITKIGQNRHVVNKNDENQPQVFMFHKHENFKWWLNLNSGQKQASQLNYRTQFIAANKESVLIKNWIDEVDKSLIMPKKDLQHKFQQDCQIKDWKFQNIFEVTLQCLLKKNMIESVNKKEGTSQKPSIWSMSSLFAGDKMDMIMKENESICYDFDDLQSDFVKKYGLMGYVSYLETKGSKKQIEMNLKRQDTKSILNNFLSKKNISQKQLQNRSKNDYIKQVIDNFLITKQ